MGGFGGSVVVGAFGQVDHPHGLLFKSQVAEELCRLLGPAEFGDVVDDGERCACNEDAALLEAQFTV